MAPFERLRAPGLLFQCFLGALAAVLVVRITPGLADAGKSQPAMFALFYLGMGLVLLVRGQQAQVDATKLFGPTPALETLQLTVVALPLGMLAIAGFWLLFLPLSFVAPDFVRAWAIANANQQPIQTLPIWISQLLVAVVVAPVVEEVLFRGILMQRWALRWGTRTGVVVSSAVFAVGHVELLGHFVFGVVLCLMYIRTRSLLLPIATHALNNLLASLGGLASVMKAQRAPQQMTMATLRADWWIAFLLLAGGLGLLEIYRRKYWGGVPLKALLDGPVPYASSRRELA